MSLSNRIAMEADQNVDPGYISDDAMSMLCEAILLENMTADELEAVIESGEALEVVTEKNIVKLDKNAKMQRAYKTAILQCAAEDKRKEYKKLRTLWKMEALLFGKLERMYKNKAKARAKEAVKKLQRSGKGVGGIAKVGNKVENKMKANTAKLSNKSMFGGKK